MTTPLSTVFITGASSGIGEAIARQFASDANCRLVLTGRNLARLKQVKATLKVPTHILCFNLCDAKSMESALLSLPAEFRDIDVLVNNAGAAFGMERAQDYDLSDWDAMVDVNIKGLMYATHALLPGMVKRNLGHIVNLGSVAASHPYVGGNVYGATKAFVHQFSRNLRADLLGTNLRVTLIEPGLVETDFFKRRFKGDVSKASAVFDGIVALSPLDIAQSVFWCVSQPAHININLIELMPVCQAPSTISVHRENSS